ncbi:hypothetical protein [Pareuzebyella sediminis]|uniref:hypothetical protein n=1 Tax=Pareuzebyella sediminis TaxID=2607998 RepID=UPI0011EF8809|nr:hypothetical protein [Pareuzebyella sediminis]
MKASDVYTIAKELPPVELHRLYKMIGQKIPEEVAFRSKRKKLPDFSVEDAIRYLIDNHM